MSVKWTKTELQKFTEVEGRGIGKIHSKASVGCTGRLQARMGIGGKHGISEEDEGSLGH